MTPLFKKLNYKSQSPVWIVNAPESFESEMSAMKEFTEIKTLEPLLSDKPGFVLAFAAMKSVLDELSEAIAPVVNDETVLWFAYPKQTSKKYKCDYNRDKGWNVLEEYGFIGVRQISIDDDWSALRFKKTTTTTRRK